jgi:hypothetical protein
MFAGRSASDKDRSISTPRLVLHHTLIRCEAFQLLSEFGEIDTRFDDQVFARVENIEFALCILKTLSA